MRRTIFSSLVLLALAFVSCFSRQTTGETIYQWVKGIEGKDHEGRRRYIEGELHRMGVQFREDRFSTEISSRGNSRTIEGTNIIVSLGKGSRNIIVGAHFDAVPNSPGANDNGSGVAVLLGLIESLKDVQWNHSIDFCFFDQEERGLIGSSHFAATYKDSLRHLAMINLDIEGTGEDVYVGPVGGGDDDLIMPLVRRAAKTSGYVFKESAHYPPSDHLSFAEKGMENISISVVPAGDVERLVQAVANGWNIDPNNVPEVMKVMHTSNDSSSLVTPEALMKSFTLSRLVLTLLNNKGE